jgi:hypothetical protein
MIIICALLFPSTHTERLMCQDFLNLPGPDLSALVIQKLTYTLVRTDSIMLCAQVRGASGKINKY